MNRIIGKLVESLISAAIPAIINQVESVIHPKVDEQVKRYLPNQADFITSILDQVREAVLPFIISAVESEVSKRIPTSTNTETEVQ